MRKLVSVAVALFMFFGVIAYPLASAATSNSKAKTTVTQKKVVKQRVLKKKVLKKWVVKATAKPTSKYVVKPTPKPGSSSVEKPLPAPIIDPNTSAQPASTPIPGWTPPTLPGYDVVIPLLSIPTQNALQIGEIGLVTMTGDANTIWHFRASDSDVLVLDSSVSITNKTTRLLETTWCFKGLKDGYAKLMFFSESSVNTSANTQMMYFVRVGNPIIVTPPPKPTPYPFPTIQPGAFVLLNPEVENVLKVKTTGVVKLQPLPLPIPVPSTVSSSGEVVPLPPVEVPSWTYTIGDPSIINNITANLWYFTALKPGSTTITFVSNPVNSASTTPRKVIVFRITVVGGDFVPTPKPTEPPKVTPLPTPLPGDFVALNPSVENILRVGGTAVVKMPQPYQPLPTPVLGVLDASGAIMNPLPINGFYWTYKIENPSIIDIAPIYTASLVYQPNIWYFRALSKGTTTITFISTPINDLIMAPSQIIVFKVTVVDGDVVITPRPTERPKPTPVLTPRPTEQPKPTPVLTPGPNPILILNSTIENFLKVGSIGEVIMPQAHISPLPLGGTLTTNIAFPVYSGLVWTYTIADPNIINISQDYAIPAIYPQTVWFFKALSKGSTTITFVGNPSNPLMMIPSQIVVFKITVGDKPVVQPTNVPSVTPTPWLTPAPKPETTQAPAGSATK